QKAARVITCDVDSRLLAKTASQMRGFENITFLHGDAFSQSIRNTKFDVCVTALPYSRSRDFIEWLALANQRSYRSATAIIQKEFAEKIRAGAGERNYRAVSVVAQIFFDIELAFRVGRESFEPRPRVDSEVIRLKPKNDFCSMRFISSSDIKVIKDLFSFRGRFLRSALKKILIPDENKSIPAYLKDRRIEDIRPAEFLEILSAVNQQR
ncbi:MAG: ribosomal RNA small subunit methyltransferase A, partial [Nitrososphaerales archaeon]